VRQEQTTAAVPGQVGPPTQADPSTPSDGSRLAARLAGLDAPAWIALILGVAGVTFRLVMLLLEVPPSNSDEATMGLAAIHIAGGREFPLFYYSQNYMGTLEAYLAAPIVLIFGPSVLALRIATLPMYAAFVFLAYRLTRRLYTPWLAVVTVAVLALGSLRVVKNQLFAGGGYPEISPMAVLLFLLALARPRKLTAAAFGFVLGLLVWIDWLIAPYAAAAVAVLYVRYRGQRGLLTVAGIGTAVGALPQLANILNPIGDRGPQYGPVGGAGLHLYDAVLFGIPMGTGMCGPEDCAPWQMWWGVAYPILLVIAAVVSIRALRTPGPRALATADPDELGRRLARFGLVAAATLTILLYLRSDRAASDPIASSRYLSALLISTPAILGVLTIRPSSPPRPPAGARTGTLSAWLAPVRAVPTSRWLGRTVVAATLVTMSVATVQLMAAAPALSREASRVRELVAGLEANGIDRVYGEFWTCNLITFISDERVICANVNADLTPGLDRYPPYRQLVEAAGDARYVAPAGIDMDEYLRATHDLELRFDGFNVYR
jgi:hypothetical protein